jgi:hypothetical protein
MAVIDVESLKIDEVEASEDAIFARLDERCRELFNMSAHEFIEALKAGETVDHPAAVRLEILARAFI